MSSPLSKRALILGTLMLALAVVFGAFGAHGLKATVSAEQLMVFETGVRYQFYHGFGLIMAAICAAVFPGLKLNVTVAAFMAGIFIFSFNLYLYVLTDIKVFAMIVPVGGLMFILGWGNFLRQALKLKD